LPFTDNAAYNTADKVEIYTNSTCFSEAYYTLYKEKYFLHVLFVKGVKVYVYEISEKTLLGFLASKSRGAYYHAHIKKMHQCIDAFPIEEV